MNYKIYTEMFTQLNTALAGIINAYSGVVSWISAPLRVGVTIYILLLGFAILRGAVSFPFREFIYRGTKLAALVFAVTSLYGASVGLLAMDGLPKEISEAVGARSTYNLGTHFDDMLKNALEAIYRVDEVVAKHTQEQGTNWAGIPNNWAEIVKGALVGLIILLGALLSSALGFCICAFALFALALLAAVGPLFVAALLFDSTRSFFFHWLGSVVNYVILIAFVMLVTIFIVGANDLYVQAVSAEENILLIGLKIVGFYILAFYFFLQIPSLAAGLGGGSGSLATEFAHAVLSGGASRGAQAANFTARSGVAVGRAGASAARSLYRKFKK